jgi:Predicted pPIWI-associating nuclease
MWDRVKSPGPDGLSQAATSAIELIDWFLRSAAPDHDVLEWHRSEGRADKELHGGRPTRGLRIRFMLRDRQPDGPLAEAYVSTLLVIAKELQTIKHSEVRSDMGALERLLPSVEAVFAFILPAGHP